MNCSESRRIKPAAFFAGAAAQKYMEKLAPLTVVVLQ
jgi:hypothetical protein